ncbi:MAG: hypothetical protein ACMUIA_07850 [bacterium]
MKKRLLKGNDWLKYGLGGLVIVYTILLIVSRVWPADNIRWQSFEYWDSPRNHGWITSDYPYPFFGPGIGYGSIQTIIDYAKGSRVMEVWHQPSVFNRFERFSIRHENIFYVDQDNEPQPITEHKVISFDMAARFGVEQFDQFEFQIWLMTREDEPVVLRYLPLGESYRVGSSLSPDYQQKENIPSSFASGGDPAAGIPPDYKYTVVRLGRQYQDGTWHKVIRDMERDIDLADDEERNDSDGFGGDSSRIQMIRILGNRYKIDDICFHSNTDPFTNHPPKLHRIGPMFAQLFQPFILDIRANDIDYPDKEPPLHPESVSISESLGEPKPLLYFEAYIGGRNARGTSASNLLTRVKQDEDSGELIPCGIDDSEVLPDVVRMTFTSQVFEDLIITISVSDERGLSDTEVFPLSVVNYPIANFPPRLEELEDDVYILGSGEPYFKQIVAYDYGDKRPITFFAFIDGLPYYGYGPYQEDLIKNPLGGIIEFTPVFEGIHNITVVARDTRGLTAVGEYTLVVATPGGWYNHPPILGEDIDSPQYVRAGQLFSMPVEFFDPDIEPIYYSCNIGMVSHLLSEGIETHTSEYPGWGESPSSAYGIYRGGAMYTFTTYFPGIYHVEITAYDIRGGYCTARFILDVQPWWSYGF